VIVVPATLAQAPAQDRGVSCRPVSERTGEVGCWIIAHVPQGELSQPVVFWHLYTYPSRTEAESAKGPRGTVIEALGKIWLFTIGEAGWRPSGGVRVAEIGPLQVKSGEKYTARYMEAIFNPGMRTPVHRHPGPEAWYTTAGEVCLETPEGKIIGRAGESTIVQAGPPMILTATGTEQRRSLVLILHETSQPSGFPVSDWTPKGLCRN
jgi:quercetin dioxygenase-like cupin family protein